VFPSVLPRGVDRRDFLRRISGALAFSPFARYAAALAPPRYPFAEVSPPSAALPGNTPPATLRKNICRKLPAPAAHFLDYDNDGWMDIYLVNSGKCDFYDPSPPLRNALYRNNRDGTFTDVTEKAGVAADGYGQGVAVGDYDSDGFPDIYVTQYGRSILYHNNGDGTFTDVTEKAGVAAPGWASSAVWFDYDNDGKLDLFVCRFVEFSKGKNQLRIAHAGEDAHPNELLLSPHLHAHAKLAVSQQRRRHVHRCQQIKRHCRFVGKGLGRRRHGY
jgi:enediyne biosynthesis protein E4